jgi:hypothetical protein
MNELRTALDANEVVVKTGTVNLSLRAFMARGRLYLTNKRLIFEALGSEQQKEDLDLPLEKIAGLHAGWQKLGPVPLMPNSMIVKTHGGDQFAFVTFGRSAWIEAIRQGVADQAMDPAVRSAS